MTSHTNGYTVRRQRRANTPLERFELDMRSRGLSSRTVNDRLTTIRRCANERPPELLDDVTVARFLSADHLSQSARCTYWSELSAWFRFLVDEGLREDWPMPRRPRQPRRYPRPLSDHGLARLLDSAIHRRTRGYILLAAFAGLRVHEIAKVRGEDVDLDDALLHVQGKGGHVYQIPLHPAIIDYARKCSMPVTGWWFPACTRGEGYDLTRHVGGKSVSQVVSLAMRRAGVPGTPHSLRHYFATSLVEQNVNIRTVQELLRHSSLQTTAIYTRISTKQRRDAVALLEVPSL